MEKQFNSTQKLGLTKKQKRLLDFIQCFISERQISPNFEEMMEAMGLKSKSGIHRLVTALEARGWIRRIPASARSIELVENDRDRTIAALDVVLSRCCLSPSVRAALGAERADLVRMS